AIAQEPNVCRDIVSGPRSSGLRARSTRNAARSSANCRRKLPSRQKPAGAIQAATRVYGARSRLRARRACPTIMSSAQSNAAQARVGTANNSMRLFTKVTRRAAWRLSLRLQRTTRIARGGDSQNLHPKQWQPRIERERLV